MKHWDARKKAEEIIATAQTMNASSPHPDSARQAVIAGMVVDLSNQLEQYEPTPTITDVVGRTHDADVPVPGADPVHSSESADGVHVVRPADAAAKAEPDAKAVRNGETILGL